MGMEKKTSVSENAQLEHDIRQIYKRGVRTCVFEILDFYSVINLKKLHMKLLFFFAITSFRPL